jgi:tricorn protease
MHRWITLALIFSFLFANLARAEEPVAGKDEARLLRFPTIYGDTIVFTYAGDLYTVNAKGGVARRLTSHEGFEMFPHFSPDGRHIAFTGQYDGNTEVYVIPAEGGEPKRLTYTSTLGRDDVSDRMGPNNIVLGWTPDGKYVLFRSRMHSFNDFLGQIYKVPFKGGLAEQLPLPRGGFCSFSPDGKKLAYNRVFREFRTWKRYRGGMADDIWVHDFDTKKTVNITNNKAQDIVPMWHNNKIYFLSDRGKERRMNLYVTDPEGKDTKTLTRFKKFDIKFPLLGDKSIVFEYGGWIYRYDLATDKVNRVPIKILEDRVGARAKLHSVAKEITNSEISPDGKYALFGARGEIFIVPAKTGATRNLTNSPGVHERNSKWSPDGKNIAYISDASGEDEVWISPADGKGPARQLTTGADTYKFELAWSPDSKKILWADKKLRVQFVDLASKKVTLVVQAKAWEVRDPIWSPDSKWIAFSNDGKTGMSRIFLYSLDKEKSFPVTEGAYTSHLPCFSGDGKYLFFVSQRDFNPIYSNTEWNHAYRDMARIYFVTLAKDTKSPFRPRGEEPKKTDAAKPADKKPDDKAKTPAPLVVDLEGIQERTLRLPVKAANYRDLESVGSSLYYVRQGHGEGVSLQLYDLATRKETKIGAFGGYEISADGKKMLLAQSGKFAIVDLPKGPTTLSQFLDLTGMEMKLDRKAEWKQIFNETWRQMRDFFYDPNMHGVDWKAMRDRYEPLVEHVAHRADLTYIIGEMIAELNVGHAYVGGGDMPHPARVPLGLLGGRLSKDPSSGYVRIDKVYRGARWDPKLRSPLNDLGVNAQDGEYLIAIDGKSTKEMDNPYAALVNKVGKQVTLTLNSEPAEKGARKVIVEPVGSEAALLYHDWLEENLAKVTKATDGKVGYIHVPDMLANGLNQFARQYYPQLRKKALIIDMRGNGGGNVSPMLIERLRRDAAMITIARNAEPRVDPQGMLWGPMVCLMNEFSASDGDLFPYRFRQHKLGKLIGKRTWGGVVGIRGTLPLLDGGTLNRPEFSRYGLDGKEWVIEGHGVDPDIVVDNDPAREYAGIDDQLNRAIAEIKEELKTKEKTIPPPPMTPKK